MLKKPRQVNKLDSVKLAEVLSEVVDHCNNSEKELSKLKESSESLLSIKEYASRLSLLEEKVSAILVTVERINQQRRAFVENSKQPDLGNNGKKL